MEESFSEKKKNYQVKPTTKKKCVLIIARTMLNVQNQCSNIKTKEKMKSKLRQTKQQNKVKTNKKLCKFMLAI